MLLLDGPARRYSTHMKVTIDLSPAQAERLRQEAERLGLAPEDLARAAVADLLATKDDDFPGVVPAPRLMRYVTLGEVVEQHRRLLQDRLLSKLIQLRLLCAFPDNRRGTAARRGRGRVPQLVTADGERPLLFSPTPIGKRGGRDLEGKGLVRRVDG